MCYDIANNNFGGTTMVLNCSYYSTVLLRNVEFNVLIPTPTSNGGQLRKEPFKVLYLFHGLHGDAHSWLHRSNISRHIEDSSILVVMPDVRNSFYQDMVYGENYFTYLTKELPEYIRTIFPVSKKREDTFVAGLSMGGYGAWYLALKCPEQYAAAASLSGFLDAGFRVTPPLTQFGDPATGKIPPFLFHAYGDMTKIAGSDRDIIALFEKDQQTGTLPRLYQSCGTEDFLFQMNQRVKEALTEMGAQIDYREVPGYEHEWDLWDLEIKNVLKWILE